MIPKGAAASAAPLPPSENPVKYKHILEPVTDGGKLMRSLRLYQSKLGSGKAVDRKEVAETLVWFDEQNSRLPRPSQRATKLIAALWVGYCDGGNK